jgi:hypothetical protein
MVYKTKSILYYLINIEELIIKRYYRETTNKYPYKKRFNINDKIIKNIKEIKPQINIYVIDTYIDLCDSDDDNDLDYSNNPIKFKVQEIQTQQTCCIKGCYNQPTNRLRTSLKTEEYDNDKMFKWDYIQNNMNRICNTHYFKDLYYWKKNL